MPEPLSPIEREQRRIARPQSVVAFIMRRTSLSRNDRDVSIVPTTHHS